MLTCIPKDLPAHLFAGAAKIAREVNPANGVPEPAVRAMGLDVQRIAILTSKYWGAKGVDLGVTFVDTTNNELKAKILKYMNKWSQYGNIRFRESASGQVRIDRGPTGYWSYLGTDILSIPKSEPTMNLEGFTVGTPDSEYERVICHETGHTLGCPHEHERKEILALLDVEKTVAWFAANVGWDRQTVMEQVFDPIDPAAIQATAADVQSIMAYQFPGACTKDGRPIPGGLVIDLRDGSLMAQLYPLITAPPPPPPPPATGMDIGLSLHFDPAPDKVAVKGTGNVAGTYRRNS